MKMVNRLAAVAAAAFIGGICVADAADLGTYDGSQKDRAFAYEPASEMVYNWAGLYAGVHAGFASTKFDGVYDEGGELSKTLEDPSLNGAVFGGQVGYNWQSGGWVYGIEGDVSHSGQSFSFIDDEGSTQKGSIDLLASVRARLGITTGGALLYVTGGLAYADATFEAIESDDEEPDSGKARKNALGGIVGAGLEYALSPTISLRGEVLHYIFNDNESIANLTIDSEDEDRWELHDDTVFRMGVNVKLGGM